MNRRRTTTALVTLAVSVGVAIGGGSTLAPATAAAGRVGHVDAHRGLLAHYVPTSAAPRYGSYRDGARVRLVCTVRGASIGGDDRWYLVRGSKRRWVSARYVDVGTTPRVCGDGHRSSARVTTARLNRREAPTLRAAAEGVLKRHARVSVVCWADGLGEGKGDTRWYQLGNGSWVSADYVGPSRRRVELCA